MDGVEQLTATGTLPLTDLQQAYLVGATRLVELGGVRPTFYLELDVPGLDLHRLRRAVDLLIAQHDQLRSEVLPEGSQRVLPPDRVRPYRLVVTDLVGLDPDRQQQALGRTRERMAEHGVEPTGWPLFELEVSRLRRHRARVHVAMSLLLLDGRSIRQVWREFQALYRDPDAPLPTSPLTFQECRLDQLAEEHTTAYAAQWRYWADRLDSLPEAPRLPRARRSVDQVRFTRRTCHLTAVEWRQLSASARGHRLTPTAALLHLFAETLATWATSPRFCLTVLHQGWVSEHPEAAGVVGQFGSTLPLEVSGEGDFWQRGRGTQSQLWRDFEHSAVSGVRIAREVAARRGRAPHASVPYVFTSMLEPSGAPGRTGCRTVHSSLRTPQVLIDNQVVDADDGGIDCVWDVVDDAFPPGLPDLMFAAYQTMIRTVAGPDGAHTVPDPVPADHRARTAALNATTRDTGPSIPAGRLEDGFLRQAAAHPEAPAVVTPTHTLTYGQLHAASAAVAGLLRARGVGPGDVVPVVMTKGWEQVVAVLGVLRAGAAYCPIDAGLPAERIRALLGEVSARVALGQSYAAVDFGVPDMTVLPVDRWETADSPPGPVVEGSELAYIIYTSGSTGRPKGVMIEHRACLNTVLDINDRIGLHAGDRVFGISSLSFDLSVWDVFGTLAAGATLVLPAAGTRPDPVGWTAAAARHGVTVWNSVPALAQLLVETVAGRPELGRPPIRVFLLSGDWIPLPLPKLIGRAWPGTRLLALGGATEASIWSNFYEVGEVAPGWASIPYGTPLRNQTMRVLDDRMELRAPWAEGGIYIGGAGLARGYWQDEPRTVARFVDHPSTGERLYRTGDLGRYWPDGTIEFLGRADRQLKIQGFRVEPGEVEAALCEHPAVDTCVVGVEQVPGGQQRLVGLVVPASNEGPSGAALTEYLRTRLPGYLVPARIVVVPALPLTANGKVDAGRAMATLVDAATPATRPTPAGPATTDDDELVQRLCRIWADLLGRPEVAADDDVFALGGTSLLLLRLINQIRDELGAEVPFGRLFETPTMRALAARIGPPASAADRADAQERGAACAVELATRPGPPLVLFHPVGGAVTSYLPLAGAWPGPVRAFQSRGLTGRHPGAGPDLAAMAAGYRSELQRLTAAGAFLLGGWSMGGVLAYEVGRQLTAAGARCRVVMIDSPPAFPAPPDEPAAAHLDFLHDLGGGRTHAPMADQIRRATAAEMASTALRAAVEHDLLPITVDVAAYTRLQAVHAHNTRLLAAYRPGLSTSPTLLIVAGGSTDAAAGWRAVCPQLTVRTLPADHYSVMSAGRATTLVAVITEWLASADASTGPTGGETLRA